MARKNLLAGLTGGQLTAVNSDPGAAVEPTALPAQPLHLGVMGTRGAIGAVTRSIEQLKAQSILEIDPHLIEASFIADRLESADEHHRALVESIREHGQQVPVLVRPHPHKNGYYQIAYGRRRLLAASELGRKIRAIIKPLSDDQLVVAQGQENSARKDLTFIEKALFAARLEQRGYSRETIMAALTVDKTALSRLISSAVRIPQDLIESIGPAPSIGRDRWVELSTRLERPGAIDHARATVAEPDFKSLASDDRFNRVVASVTPAAAKTQRLNILKAKDGSRFGHFKEDARTVSVSIDKKIAGDFAGYLVEVLPNLYAAFKLESPRKKEDS
jgi:ParB family transcriptional regulator, chromosome partitioning protein